MEETIIYLIRHAETVDKIGFRNTDASDQIINKKEIICINIQKEFIS